MRLDAFFRSARSTISNGITVYVVEPSPSGCIGFRSEHALHRFVDVIQKHLLVALEIDWRLFPCLQSFVLQLLPLCPPLVHLKEKRALGYLSKVIYQPLCLGSRTITNRIRISY